MKAVLVLLFVILAILGEFNVDAGLRKRWKKGKAKRKRRRQRIRNRFKKAGRRIRKGARKVGRFVKKHRGKFLAAGGALIAAGATAACVGNPACGAAAGAAYKAATHGNERWGRRRRDAALAEGLTIDDAEQEMDAADQQEGDFELDEAQDMDTGDLVDGELDFDDEPELDGEEDFDGEEEFDGEDQLDDEGELADDDMDGDDVDDDVVDDDGIDDEDVVDDDFDGDVVDDDDFDPEQDYELQPEDDEEQFYDEPADDDFYDDQVPLNDAPSNVEWNAYSLLIVSAALSLSICSITSCILAVIKKNENSKLRALLNKTGAHYEYDTVPLSEVH